MGACTGAVGARLGVVLTGGARLVVAQGERVGCVAEWALGACNWAGVSWWAREARVFLFLFPL